MDLVSVDANKNIGLVLGNPEDHPLLIRMVLYNIFEYLKMDSNTLLKCRIVNPEWTECISDTKPASFCIHLKNTEDVQSLRRLLSNPNATLACKNLKLGDDVNINDLTIFSLIEEYGKEIRQLTICPSVTALPVLIALNECPQLVHLTMDPLSIRGFEMPKMLPAWDKSLPPLRSLTINISHQTSYEWEEKIEEAEENGGADLIADLGLEKPFDFIVLLISKMPTVEKLSLNNLSLNTWNRLATRLGQRPHIIQQLQNVNLQFENLQDYPYDQIWTHRLKIKSLEVENSVSTFSNEFSTLLAEIAPTLETLIIQKDKEGRRRRNPETLHMIFENQMAELKDIHIVSTMDSLVDCSAPGNINIFRQLPKLRSFKAQANVYRFYEYKLKSLEGVWQKMIPVTERSEVNQFGLNELREFCIDWIMPSYNFIVVEIGRCFPNLRKVGLTLQGLMIHEVVEELSGSQIQDMELTYFGAEKKIDDEFASALTGISLLSCKKYELRKGKDVEMEKVRKTFADWISLKHLIIHYKYLKEYGRDGRYWRDRDFFTPLTDVVVNYGFAKIVQLETLSLNGFGVRLIQISNILNEVPLHTLDLTACDLKKGGCEMSIIEIREMFPKVNLELDNDDEDLDDEDEEGMEVEDDEDDDELEDNEDEA